MNRRKKIAAGLAKAIVVVGVFPLTAGVMAGVRYGSAGGAGAYGWAGVGYLSGAGAAFVAAGIALDRWACRQPDRGASGFDVVAEGSEDDED